MKFDLSSNQRKPIKSFGYSMLPILRDGDIIYIKKVKFQNLRTNDIICFKKNKRFLTHRIIYRSKSYVITRGDNNAFADGKITTSKVIGKIYKIKRDKDYFSPDDIYLFQSTHYFNELITVTKLFDIYDLNYVFLKGLPLHLFYEKKLPKKIYADCDLLVHPKNLKKLLSLLINHGYKKYNYTSELDKKLNMFDREGEVSYYKIVNGLKIIFDIHSEVVFSSTSIGKIKSFYSHGQINKLSDQILDNKRIVTLNNIKFPILTPDYLLLYLSLHFVNHNYRGIQRLEFISKILEIEIKKIGGNLLFNISKIAKEHNLLSFISPVFLLLLKYFPSRLLRKYINIFTISKFPFYKRHYIKTKILNINIFDDQIIGGEHFIQLFFLSSNHFLFKILVFLNLSILLGILLILYKKYFLVGVYRAKLKIKYN